MPGQPSSVPDPSRQRADPVPPLPPRRVRQPAPSPWTRSFSLFFCAQSLSWLGSSMTPVALSLGLLDLGEDLSSLSLVLAANSIPLVGLLLLGGVVADRLPRAVVLVSSHLTAGATQGVVAWWFFRGGGDLTLLVVASGLNGAASAFTGPALRGILTQLVDREAIGRANALRATSRNLFRLAGPGVAGVLVSTTGAGWALGIDAACALGAAVLLAVMEGQLRRPHRCVEGTGGITTTTAAPGTTVVSDATEPAGDAVTAADRRTGTTSGRPRPGSLPGGVWHDLTLGWLAFTSRQWLWVVTASFFWTNLLLGAVWLVLAPAIARGSIGETAWGTVLSARAAGLVLGGVLAYRLTPHRPLVVGQLLTVPFGTCFLVLGLGASAPVLAASTFLAGVGAAVTGVLWESAMQRHVPGDQLSRVASIDMLGSFAAVPIGQLLAPVLAQHLGGPGAAVGGGIAYVLLALVPLLVPSVRRFGS